MKKIILVLCLTLFVGQANAAVIRVDLSGTGDVSGEIGVLDFTTGLYNFSDLSGEVGVFASVIISEFDSNVAFNSAAVGIGRGSAQSGSYSLSDTSFGVFAGGVLNLNTARASATLGNIIGREVSFRGNGMATVITTFVATNIIGSVAFVEPGVNSYIYNASIANGLGTVRITEIIPASEVPLPAAFWFMGAGLLAMRQKLRVKR